MTAQPVEHVAPELVWAVYDGDRGDFVAAFTTQRAAQTHADDLELAEHDFGARGVDSAFTGHYFERYSIDHVPASDVAVEVRP